MISPSPKIMKTNSKMTFELPPFISKDDMTPFPVENRSLTIYINPPNVDFKYQCFPYEKSPSLFALSFLSTRWIDHCDF